MQRREELKFAKEKQTHEMTPTEIKEWAERLTPEEQAAALEKAAAANPAIAQADANEEISEDIVEDILEDDEDESEKGTE
jgi:hypothetical protein